MNKELRKKIESQLSTLISNALSAHNKIAASDVSKNIREHVKAIAKKFVKHIPVAPVTSKPAEKKSAPKKKAVAKAAPVKKAKSKTSRSKVKVKARR